MTTLTESGHGRPGFWTRTWRALRAFDETLHHDPSIALHRRIGNLEARLRDAETVRPNPEDAG